VLQVACALRDALGCEHVAVLLVARHLDMTAALQPPPRLSAAVAGCFAQSPPATHPAASIDAGLLATAAEAAAVPVCLAAAEEHSSYLKVCLISAVD
jgi:hypothetical protein